MKVKGIAKRIMAFVVSLMLAFSTVPELSVFADPSASVVWTVDGNSSGDTAYTKGSTASLSAKVTAAEGKTVDNVMIKNTSNELEIEASETETGSGEFSATVNLDSDTNKFKAIVTYDDGTSEDSGEIEIVKDNQNPQINDVTYDHKDDGQYSNKPVIVTVDATDNVASGIAYVEYQTGSEAAKRATLSGGKYEFTAATGGTYTITAYDKAGNYSNPPQTANINIDKTAPTFTATGNWSNGGKIKVTVSDFNDEGGSGRDKIYYSNKALSADSSSGSYYKNSADTSIKTIDNNGEVDNLDSAETWYFYAADKAGNLSAAKVISMKDNSAPTVSVSWKWNDNNKINITDITADDSDGSGIEKIYYSKKELSANSSNPDYYKNNDSEIKNIGVNERPEIEPGVWYFYAADNLGNLSTKFEVNAVDENIPTVTITAKSGGKVVNSGDTVIDTVTLTVKGEDTVGEGEDKKEESGIKCIYYGTTELPKVPENESEIKDYSVEYSSSKEITIEPQANQAVPTTYYCYAVDRSGKISDCQSFTVTIDKINMEIDDIKVSKVSLSEIFKSVQMILGEDSFTGILPKGVEDKDKTKAFANSPIKVEFSVKASENKPVSSVKVTYGETSDPKSLEVTESGGKYYFTIEPDDPEATDYTVKNLKITVTNNKGETQTKDYSEFRIYSKKPTILISEDNHEVKVNASLGTDTPENNSIEKIVYDYSAQTKPKKVLDAAAESKNIVDNNTNIKFNGNNTISICAIDSLGNVSDVVIAKDVDKPVLTVTPPEDKWGHGTLHFKLKVNDPLTKSTTAGQTNFRSKLTAYCWIGDKTFDQIDKNDWNNIINLGEPEVNEAGEHVYSADKYINANYDGEQIHFIVVDEAGNSSEQIDHDLYNDNTVPEIAVEKKPDREWANKADEKVTVNLKVTKMGNSGIDSVYAQNTTDSSDIIYCDEKAGSDGYGKKDQYTFTFNKDTENKTYQFFAKSVAGKTSNASSPITINLDTMDPEILSRSSDSEGELTSKDVTVTVKAQDAKKNGIASGIKSITAVPVSGYNGKEIKVENATDGKYVFKFTENQNATYEFTVEDKAGNKSTYSETTVVIKDDSQPKVDSVESSKEGEWINKDVTVKVKASAPNSETIGCKVKRVVCVLEGKDPRVEENIIDSKDSVNSDNEYVFTFKEDQDKKYQFYAQNDADTFSDVSKTTNVKIDKTLPQVTVTKVEDKAEYGFGIFSNENIRITLKATDPQGNGVTSGVQKLKMTAVVSGSGEKIENVLEKANENGEYVFEIPSVIAQNTFALDTLYNSISFTATDVAGNDSVTKTLKELFNKSSNALVDTQKPVISEFSFPQPDYRDGQGRRWFATANVKAEVTVSDNAQKNKDASGIESANISTANGIQKYNIKTDAKSAETSHTLTLISSAKDVKNDGELKFFATVTDLAKNKFSTTDDTKRNDVVYVDTKAPEITGITVNGTSITGSNGVYAVPVFANTARTIRIDARDLAGTNTGASGVRSITYTLHDVNTNTTTAPQTVNVISGSYITFTVAPNFKGYINAYATDNVGNKSETATTKRFVAENSTQHGRTSDINITIPETSYRDVDGRRLYANDVNATISVSDTYSGIRSVEYTLGEQWTALSNMRVSATDSNIITAQTGSLNITDNRNNIVLRVRITDNAGNQSTEEINFSIDKTAPKIEVAYDNNDYNTAYRDTQYFKANRRATITISERNFRAADLVPHLFANSGSTPVVSSFVTHTNTANPDLTTHVATVDFTNDADYTAAFDYSDLAQNKAPHYGEDKFTIDKTAPTTEVSLSSNPTNGKYFNQSQTVTVKINEHNFDQNLVNIIPASGTLPDRSTWQWSSAGDTHTATFTVANDGIYSFTVRVADKARNNAPDAVKDQFVVDKTKPDAAINDVKDSQAYGFDTDIHPTIEGKDVNLEKVTYTITKKLSDGTEKDVTKDFSITSVDGTDDDKKVLTYRGMSFDKKTDLDGIYTINASVTDLAGNITPIQKTFSINRFGANFTVDDETKKALEEGYFKEGQRLTIRAINVSPITDEKITVTLNGNNTVITKGTDYRVNEEHTDGWYSYEYVIEPRAFGEDGSYSVSISATDAAGNVSSSDNDPHNKDTAEGKIEFSVDKVKPAVSITGADDGQSYKEDSKEITVTFEDKNLDKDTINIEINGKKLSESDYNADISSGVISVKFNVTETDAEVTAYITDLAGNESDHAKLSFKLDQNWLQRFYNNYKGAFFGTIGGIVAVIAAIILLIVKRKKDR